MHPGVVLPYVERFVVGYAYLVSSTLNEEGLQRFKVRVGLAAPINV